MPFIFIPLFVFYIWKFRKIRKKYAPILDVDAEAKKLEKENASLKTKIEELRAKYSKKHSILKSLEEQVAVYDDKLSFVELGIYEPHFDFNDSENYKQQIKKIREHQKLMVSNKVATDCPANWEVDGSKAKGQAMINRQMRLTMRAFNNECEAAIANTRWNNVNAMERRILNSAKQINSANQSLQLEIRHTYVELKLDELYLTHEYREQKKIEKEEKAEIARAEREEKKLEAEAKRAEAEEKKFQDLLDKARKEAGVDETKIAELEAKLAAAHELTERAKAMAEVTKSGYVYVISNIGSFGEDVVKIGLTRRLDPTDRVKELGDASVPFGFDTHAMIYSEKAPDLEAKLHKEFTDKRVNSANFRKEFFRVSIDEVEQAVTRLAPDASFFKDREAQEWHETVALRQQALTDMQKPSDRFPESI